uniref:Uncharacterized protein n=1 Tax=Rhizophora mucronata TaxID=61149 RepID=A0A2P2P2F5_RHIMU
MWIIVLFSVTEENVLLVQIRKG